MDCQKRERTHPVEIPDEPRPLCSSRYYRATRNEHSRLERRSSSPIVLH